MNKAEMKDLAEVALGPLCLSGGGNGWTLGDGIHLGNVFEELSHCALEHKSSGQYAIATSIIAAIPSEVTVDQVAKVSILIKLLNEK